MNEILAVGGAGYIVPAVLFVLVLYLVRGLFGLHSRRSQNRREFLELWDGTRSHDELWLEVAVRHLCGAYLPAHVIRLALAQPDKSQSLFDLAELWPLFRFDAESRTVTWQLKRHNSLNKRRAGRVLLLAGYFACALLAVLAAVIASKSGAGTFLCWVYSVLAIVSAFAALICLMREDTIKVSATVGDDWLTRINQVAPSKRATRDPQHQGNPTAAAHAVSFFDELPQERKP